MSSLFSPKAGLGFFTRACIGMGAASASGMSAAELQVDIDHSSVDTELRWQGSDGTAYWLESASDLSTWQTEPGVTLGTAGALSRQVDDSAPTAFYRLTAQAWELGEAFSSDPQTRGWSTVSSAQEIFPDQAWPGTGVATSGTQIWQSPPMTLAPGSYFRVDFQHRGSGSAWVASRAFNSGLNWGRYPSSHADSGQLLENDTESWSANSNWADEVFISRTSEHATTTAIELWGQGIDFDNVVVTALSREAALEWADHIYGHMPALSYTPPVGRHQYLSETLSLLQNGDPLKVIFVGDSLMQDAANSMLDVLLERRFPGSTIEIQAATGQGTGINKWNDDASYDWPDQDLDLDNAVIEQRPDLVLLGGISNNFTDWDTSFRELIGKIRTRSIARWGSAPDILIMTGPPFYSPQGTYNADLATIASEEGVAFLDLYSAVLSYVTPSFTISDLQRDTYHANTFGKQLFGRILLEWFEPEPVAAFHYASSETIVLEQQFSDNPQGWEHSQTLFQNGELIAVDDTRWSQAVLPLDAALPMTDRICNFYWEMRTDPAAGEDVSALHPKLHVTNEESRFEQISLNTIIRAAWFWMFYVDPGFLVAHPHERHPRAIPGFFSDSVTTEKFRIRTQPVDSNTLLAQFQYYDPTTEQWSNFVDALRPERSVDILIDISNDLEGYSTIRGLNFMFPHAVSSVQATALTWEPIVGP